MYVSRLFVHPVKSLGGVSVESYIVDRFGPQWDRRWMVVDEQGKFITQRQLAAMALIKAKMVQDNVQLTAASGEALEFSAADFNAGEDVTVQVWRDQCVAKLGPAHVHAAWYSCTMPASGRWMNPIQAQGIPSVLLMAFRCC